MRKEECNYTENIMGSPSLFQLKVLGGQEVGVKNRRLQQVSQLATRPRAVFTTQ